MNPFLKKGQDPVLIVDAPEEHAPILSKIPSRVHTDPEGNYGFVQFFVKDLESTNKDAEALKISKSIVYFISNPSDGLL